MMFKTYQRVSLEIKSPPAGTFIIGRSLIGGTDVLGETGNNWVNLINDAQDLTIERGGTKEGAVTTLDIGLVEATGLDNWSPALLPAVKPNTPIRVVYKEGATGQNKKVLYTGVLQDILVTERKDGHSTIQVTAVDGYASLGNTTRYGAVSDNSAGFENWESRIRRYAQSANTPLNPPDTEASFVNKYYYDTYKAGKNPSAFAARDGWTLFGTAPSGVSGSTAVLLGKGYLDWKPTASTTGTKTIGSDNSWGIERIMFGLTIGRRYMITGRYTELQTGGNTRFNKWDLGVLGIGFTNQPLTSSGVLTYEFVATAKSHTVRFGLQAQSISITATGQTAVAAGFSEIYLWEYPLDNIVLQDVAYEGSLADHFDMACNSVGGVWWVDANNVVQFRTALEASDPVEAAFTDVTDNTPRDVLTARINATTDPWMQSASVTNYAATLTATSYDAPTPVPWGKARHVTWVGNSTNYLGALWNAPVTVTGVVGDVWTASIYVKTNTADTFGLNLMPVFLSIKTYNGSGTQLETVQSGVYNTLPGWQRIDITFTASQAYASIRCALLIGWDGGSSTVAGNYVDVTGLLFERVDTVKTYFDGGSPLNAMKEYAWTGTAGSSPSAEGSYGIGPVVEYTNLSRNFNTKRVVNDLRFNNHGRDAGTGNALDVTIAFKNSTSIASWNQRSQDLETCIKNDGVYAGSATLMAAKIMADTSDTDFTVDSLTFLGHDNPLAACSLDIFSKVSVLRNGNATLHRVTGIRHEFEDDRWFVTLQLTKEEDN